MLTRPFWSVEEVSHELAELGKTLGVMPSDLHKVFIEASRDIDRVAHELPKSPDVQHEVDRMKELQERWQDVVFSACKTLLEEV